VCGQSRWVAAHIFLTAAMLRVPDCVIRFGVPEPTEWQRIGN
jgi:hypothetical protein